MKERPEYSLVASGKKMRKIRKARRLTVEDVRKYMKLGSVQAVYKWENGQCFPTADNLLALAQLYEVEPTELLVKKQSGEGLAWLWLKEADYLIRYFNV